MVATHPLVATLALRLLANRTRAPRWDAGFTVVDASYSTSEWFNLKTTKALGLNVPLHRNSPTRC